MNDQNLPSEDDTTSVVAVREAGGAIEIQEQLWQPSPLALLSTEDFKRRIEVASLEVSRLQEIQIAIMDEGVDYGLIPGVDKPALFQPGAQKLCRFAGFVPKYSPEKICGDGLSDPVISYTIRCQLIDQRGTIMGEGYGAANSWEVKHRYRFNDKTCPECSAATIRRSKKEYGGGYYCNTKKGGCGAKFQTPESEALLDNQPDKVQNPDQHDLDNTLLKMGCKRAFVAAVVQAFACSGQFSQDAPEMPGAGDRGDEQGRKDNKEAQSNPPKSQGQGGGKGKASAGGDPASDGQVKLAYAKLGHKFSEMEWASGGQPDAMAELLEPYGCRTFEDMKKSQVTPILAAIEALT